MTKTVTVAFDLPSREDITAQEFVVKLAEDDDAVVEQKLIADYVFTPTVERELPVILEQMRHVLERGEELGRFIHGSFGSGKSHFMALLGMLLEDHEGAWAKDAAIVRTLASHRSWIRQARPLVVRLHMLTADDARFDRMAYQAANRALERAGCAPFEYLHVQGVLDEMEREAGQYGDAFWSRLHEAGVVASQNAFRLLVDGELDDREQLARAYLAFKGRDADSAGIDPNWAEGLQRLTAHVKAAGFGGLVFLVDELLLWLGEKTKPEFTKAINQLNVMVDHTDGRRAVPLFVFVARQRRLKEFFPDMVSDDPMEEHLDHHSKRFETTTLQDVELRHICRQRVLKRKDPAAVEGVIDALAEQHKKLLPAILQGGDVAYLRDVYPFHPALIETLIDVSSLMQRERTALRLLYELLVIHYPTLPLGSFLPVGSAFEAIFPEDEKPQGRRKLDDLASVHRLYYESFRPAMRQMRAQAETDEGLSFDDADYRVLDQLVKTALLAELSTRLKAGGLTVERLVRLNEVDVAGHTDRGKMTKARQALVELARRVHKLQVTGDGKEARVGIVLHGANVEEHLERARGKVAQHNVRLKAFSAVLKEALGLEGREWEEGAHEGRHRVAWKGTRRSGSVAIKNVRALSNAEFRPEPGERFRILIDYPWDEPGFNVEADLQRAQQVRRREGTIPTVCWLPRHMTSHELDALSDYAAADYLCSSAGAELLEGLAPHDRTQVVQQADARRAMMKKQVVESLSRLYREHGQVYALIDGVLDHAPELELGKNLDRFAQSLLDRQYPQHPTFGVEPSSKNMQVVCQWLLGAADAADGAMAFEDGDAKVLKGLAVALELVDLGQTGGRLRQDTRYLKAVLDQAGGERVPWGPIDELLAGPPYGFEPVTRNLLLLFVARLHSYRVLDEAGSMLSLELDNRVRTGLVLERAQLVSVAEWSRLRELGPALLSVTAPDPHRTVSEQDRYATLLRECGAEVRKALTTLHQSIQELLAEATSSSRLERIRTAQQRLAPLVRGGETHAMLRELLELWPDDTSDPVRELCRGVEPLSRALGGVQRHTVSHLRNVPAGHPKRSEVDARLDELSGLVADATAPLTEASVTLWNERAAKLVGAIIATHAPPLPTPRSQPESALGGAADFDATVDTSDPDALTDLWKRLRSQLEAKGGRVHIRVAVKSEG